MNNQTNTSITALKIIISLVAVAVISACSGLNPVLPTLSPLPDGSIEPPATVLPTECKPLRLATSSGLALLTFIDGSQVFLGSNTELTYIPMDSCAGATAHQVTLVRGEIAVSSLLPPSDPFAVYSPGGGKATIEHTGLVRFDTGSGVFQVNCTRDGCSLTSGALPELLACGQAGQLDLDGQFSGPDDIDLDQLSPYGDWLMPKCDLAPTQTPEADFDATATAACSNWLNQFPLTPCPTTINP